MLDFENLQPFDRVTYVLLKTQPSHAASFVESETYLVAFAWLARAIGRLEHTWASIAKLANDSGWS